MRYLSNAVLALFFSLLLIAPVAAAEKFDALGLLLDNEAPIELSAQGLKYDEDLGIVSAWGDVTMTQDEIVLKAESLSISFPTSTVSAAGDVFLTNGVDEFSCQELEYNFKEATGTIIEGELQLTEMQYYLSGKEFRMLGQDRYQAEDATLTTCRGESPAWRFRVKRVTFTVEGYGELKGASLEVRKVPVLYLPWLAFPVKIERQTGFLPPRISYSDERGLRVDNYFFWAIGPHTDATFNLDAMTRAGIGAGGEFRYTLPQNSWGRWRAYYLREYDTAANRAVGSVRHDQYFDRTLYFKADVAAVSDDEYFRDYGEYLVEEAQDHLESNLFATKNFNPLTVSLGVRHWRYLQEPTDTAPQELPWATLSGSYLKLNDIPVRFGLDTAALNIYRREKEESGATETLFTGRRADMKPSVSVPFTFSDYASVIPKFTWWETLYDSEDYDSEDSHRELYEISLWTGTSVSRVFESKSSFLPKFKHYIEPSVEYVFVPDVDQDDLPYLNSADRVQPVHQLRVKLTSRLTAPAKDKGYLPLAYLSLGSWHNLGFKDEQEESWSMLFVDGRVQPLSDLIIGCEGKYPLQADRAVTEQYYYVKWSILDKTSAAAGYSYGRDSHEFVALDIEQRLTDSLQAVFSKKHSFADDSYLEDIYGLKYRHHCWDAEVTYSQRPAEKRFEIYVTLTGIGRAAAIKGALN